MTENLLCGGGTRPGDYARPAARLDSLLNSRSHSTELATAAQRSQSPALRLTVENACCKNGT
jgi:hypothetical protein